MTTLTSLYHTFHETYSKKYGENTCIMMLVGKFYELYGNTKGEACASSVRRATTLMNIVMKEKQVGNETTLWGGVPEQSLHKFAQVLTREGWTVVVVDQVKDRADQVIDRVTARILSPGTHVETATQERMTVAAICMGESISAAVVDLTTGEIFSFETKVADEVLHMLQVYSVRETIIASSEKHDLATIRQMFGIHGILHPFPECPFTPFQREEYLRRIFRLKTMMPIRTALGLSSTEIVVCTLLRFVEDHFPQHIITGHELYTPKEYMRLSNNILEQLNIISGQRPVLSLLEKTHSAIGKRSLRERILRPITDSATLEKRWSQVSFLVENRSIHKTLKQDLKALYDIPRLHHTMAGGSLTATDVLHMFQSYSATICLIQNLRNTPLACPQTLEDAIVEFRRQVKSLLDEEKAQQSFKEPVGFLTSISGPATAVVEEKIQKIQETWAAMWKKFCSSINLPVDSFHLISEDYTWEGSRTYLKAIQGAIFASASRTEFKNLQVDHKKSGPITLQSSEIYTFTDSLRTAVNQLQIHLKRELQPVCDTLWDAVRPIQTDWVAWIGCVDTTLALASVAIDLNWIQPTIGDSLCIKGLRHPLLETSQTREEYVKHDVSLGGHLPNGWLIYGVNASGKSSLMKATGIAVILAQAGSFVPATTMSIQPYDAAFSRIWTHDNIWAGLSSFAVEVSELRDIILSATERSLVLGDEVCSGTESMSATALVASTLEHLDSVGTHFMFATHLHDLMKVGFLPRPGIAVWHLRVQNIGGKLIYDRTLQPGSGSCTYGLEVARAMGIPLTLIDRAHEIRRILSGETANGAKSTWNSQILRKSCEMCGSPILKDLEVHHITPRSEGGNNRLRNLIVLCEGCHDKEHSGGPTVGELQMTSEGLTRTVSETSMKSTKVKTKWNEEEMESIRATIKQFEGRPITRVVLALDEKGIKITPGQLRSLS